MKVVELKPLVSQDSLVVLEAGVEIAKHSHLAGCAVVLLSPDGTPRVAFTPGGDPLRLLGAAELLKQELLGTLRKASK